MCWNKGRLCWKIAKLFYFCHLKKLVRPETFGPYNVHLYYNVLCKKHKICSLLEICIENIWKINAGMNIWTKRGRRERGVIHTRNLQLRDCCTSSIIIIIIIIHYYYYIIIINSRRWRRTGHEIVMRNGYRIRQKTWLVENRWSS